MNRDTITKLTVFRTAIGWCGVVERGCRVERIVIGAASKRQTELAAGVKSRGTDSVAARQIKDLLAGMRRNLAFPVSLACGTPFARNVWRAAGRIPYGSVRTYGWVAAKAGRPGAARAAGSALSRNPLPLYFPCHRVVGAGGRIGGFTCTGGIAVKKELQRIERSATGCA
jgi:methylated-DNA-[protein]-cysteine S-methyltransferase